MVELKEDRQDRKEPSPSMMNGHTQTKDGSPRTSKTSKDAAAPTPAALANKVLPESIVKDMQFRSHSLRGVDLLWLLVSEAHLVDRVGPLLRCLTMWWCRD